MHHHHHHAHLHKFTLWSAFSEVITHIDALQSFSLIAVMENNNDDNDTFASCYMRGG